MLCNNANAQTKKAAPNEIVVQETKTVVVPPKSKAKFTRAKKSSITTTETTKNGFSHTTTTTEVVPPPAASKATTTTATTTTTPQTYVAPVIAPPANQSAAVTTPPAAEAPKSPWKISYFAEYFGPSLDNFQLDHTQTGVSGAAPIYGRIDHYLKTLYAISKNNLVGFQFRAGSPFDPLKNFAFKNIRFVGVWKNMVDTPDLNMGSQLDIELPTTDSARYSAQMLLALNIRFNWEIKTQLRNWSFTAQTMIRPTFYDQAKPDNIDTYFGFFPWITMDLGPSTQLLFEASFDTSHAYSAAFFDLGSDDPDFVAVGTVFNINSHISFWPEMRFFTGDISFKSAYLYLGFNAAL